MEVSSLFMLLSSVLQHKSVPLHPAFLSSFLPGSRSHENVYSWAVELEKQAKIASQDIEKGLTDEDVRLLKEGV
ncbi:hypothetical protein ACET3Z_010016 [Daucus carota]